jgi:hypothetical protein
MRRLVALAAIVLSLGCGSDLLGPVQTVDGSWTGLQNGYSVSFVFTQKDSTVTGSADILGLAGGATGTVSGTFVYPNLDVTISFPQFSNVTYKGTMSGSDAKIFGHLDGSGFVNTSMDVRKR